jgi:hypothetical protein
MKGEGAIVFLMVFFAMLLATLAYPTMQPGRQIYSLLGVPDTDYPVLGIPTTTLVIAVFNGVVYGIIAWLIFTFAVRTIRARKTV